MRAIKFLELCQPLDFLCGREKILKSLPVGNYLFYQERRASLDKFQEIYQEFVSFSLWNQKKLTGKLILRFLEEEDEKIYQWICPIEDEQRLF